MSAQPRLVRFGIFEFDLDSLELRRQGVRVAIEPQPAKALALLVCSAGEIVSRDDLKHALWKDDVHVDFDRGLAYVISQVRTALGDSAENPRFVETLPKRGFRFIAPTFAPDGATADKQPTPPTRSFRGVLGVAALVLVSAAIVAIVVALSGKRPVLAVAIFDNET